jgi:CheY-like chemotaxis protein
MQPITALIADDEPLLREHLRAQLQRLWPELRVVDEARNGHEALELFEIHQPDVVFLDIHMPGLNGIDAARAMARRAHLVFVTAFEQYAIQAFDQGAIDYLVKPLDPATPLAACSSGWRTRRSTTRHWNWYWAASRKPWARSPRAPGCNGSRHRLATAYA